MTEGFKLTRVGILATAAALFCSGVAFANAPADPMRLLRGIEAAGDPVDPMNALKARVSSEGEVSANADFGGLPDGAGAEETYYQCVACHSTEIIKQQRVTDARWDYLWEWMTAEQGMVEPDPETKTAILGYLKEHFSSER